jgi:DNA-nicking Smr family endonuclease
MARRSPARAKRARHAEQIEGFAGLNGVRKRLAEQDRLEREAARRAHHEAEQAAREAELFRREVADVVPLGPIDRIEPERPLPSPEPLQRQLDEQAVLAESLSDEIDIERYLDTDEALSWRKPGIGVDVVRRLRRGEWVVRAQLDLHGLRVDEAREAVAAFLSRAVRDELRCLRIIHGKGLGSANREPVLKRKVPRWLAQRDEVLAFCEARPNDGGSGAMIVLLAIPGSA